MLRNFGAPLACLAMLSACVSNPSNITASYVNPVQYRGMACEEVQGELQRVSARETDLSERQRQNFVADTAMLTVGLVAFWPALLFMPATTDRKGEIAQIRGEKEALERAAARQCTTVTTGVAPPVSNGVATGITPPVSDGGVLPAVTAAASAAPALPIN